MVEFVPCKHETSVRFRLLPMEERFLRDTKATILVEKHEISKTVLRFFLRQTYKLQEKLSLEDIVLVRFIIQRLINSHPKKSASPKLINSSPFNGRTRSYYRYSKLGRMEFKQHAGAGALPGFRKSS